MITNIRAFQEVLKRNNLPTPDTYLGISELIRSLYRPDVSPNPERIREVIEALTWPVTVPAGNPITFKSCSEVLASEALVTFSPKQSGTGDPSPTNIRPISGWDSVTLLNTGVNQWNEVWELGVYDTSTGEKVSSTVRIRSKDYIPVAGGATYYFFVGVIMNIRVLYYDVNKDFISSPPGFNNTIFTVPSNAKYMTFYIGEGYGVTYNNDISINYPSTDTEYHAYTGETHTATFPSTIMGGSYDFVSGKGKSEWGYIAEYDGETINEPWISSIDVYTPGTTPSTGAEVVYKLETPTEITLTPEEIELLRGINNIRTDGDNVTVKFQILK